MAPDIAVVGGGPAGLSMAALLANHGYDFILYERSAESVPPRGGSLDLHHNAGQRVIRESGLVKVFEKSARRGAATLHRCFDWHLKPLISWGEGRDAPEIDRGVLRQVLLSGIPADRMVYGKKLEKAQRDENGQIVLHFTDGTQASGFKLVIGADGVFSKVRPLVSTKAVPIFLKQWYFSMKMYRTNPHFQVNLEKAKFGPMVIMGARTHIWNQRQGDDTFQIDCGMCGDEEFAEADELDLSDVDAVKKFLLQDKFFGKYDPWIKDLIRAAEPFPDGMVKRWMLHIMPPERIGWEAVDGVTLIGDAAHATTPFVGEGVNCAMRDACLLLSRLEVHGLTKQAIREYEQEMFTFGIDLVTRSLSSGETFYNDDCGQSFRNMMKSPTGRLVGKTDPGVRPVDFVA